MWRKIFKRKPPVASKVLPVYFVQTKNGVLWEVRHHGKMVASGTEPDLPAAVGAAKKAAKPHRLVMGYYKHEQPRDR